MESNKCKLSDDSYKSIKKKGSKKNSIISEMEYSEDSIIYFKKINKEIS